MKKRRYEVEQTSNISQDSHSVFDTKKKRWYKTGAGESAWPKYEAQMIAENLEARAER